MMLFISSWTNSIDNNSVYSCTLIMNQQTMGLIVIGKMSKPESNCVCMLNNGASVVMAFSIT